MKNNNKRDTVCRCMLLRHENSVYVVRYRDGEMSAVLFGGENYTEYDDSFWTKLRNQIGLERSLTIDFCIISDSAGFDLSDDMNDNPRCSADDSVWKRNTITKAIDLLGLTVNAEVLTNGGQRICGINGSISEESVTFTARFLREIYYNDSDSATEDIEEPSEDDAPEDTAKCVPTESAEFAQTAPPQTVEAGESSELAKHFYRMLEEDERAGAI